MLEAARMPVVLQMAVVQTEEEVETVAREARIEGQLPEVPLLAVLLLVGLLLVV